MGKRNLKKESKDCPNKIYFKIFFLKKPYKKIANNLCNMNPWINNVP